MGGVYTSLCLRSTELSKAFEPKLFQNICSDASSVQDCWNLAKTRVRTKQKYALCTNAAYLNS